MRGHSDLRRVASLAVLCALLAPLLPVEVLSLIFALPLAFFLPGYALTAAIFARRPLERPQLLLLSLGLSLAVLALGALLLDYVPGGIGPVSWAALLLIVTLGGCRAAAVRRHGDPSPPKRRRERPQMTPAGAGLLLGALACVTGALVITFTTSSARHADGYTALWLLPPTQGNAREGGARIGVGSEEQERSSYRLRVRVGDRPAEIVREFRLEPGETRVLKVNPMLPLDSAAPPVPVRAKLFLQSAPKDVYRRVSGWLAEPGRSP